MTLTHLPPDIQDKFNDGQVKVKMICLPNDQLQEQIDRAVADGWTFIQIDAREGRSTAYLFTTVTTLNGE